jgi:magnesium transporter
MVRLASLKRKKPIIKKIGEPPGTLVYTGVDEKDKIIVQTIDYNEDDFKTSEYDHLPENFEKVEKHYIRWINIKGIKQIKVIEELGKGFNLHPLVLEDIVNPHQRPKFEDYTEYVFLIMKRLMWNEKENKFTSEQISLILGSNFLISIQEHESNLFAPIIERIKTNKGRVRIMETDYLLYALMDVVIDNYFIVQEVLGELIEEIEDILVSDPKIETLQSIYKVKREIIDIRKSIWPLRAVINSLQREQSDLISDNMQIYLRDIYDHVFRISDSLENYRDIISGMLDMYLSSVSNKMNEIMKVLTIISTIFIPLSFLSGFYGMNFILPDFGGPLFFPLLIVIMIGIAVLMIGYFKKKNWI